MAKPVDSWTPSAKPVSAPVRAPKQPARSWKHWGRPLIFGALVLMGGGFVIFGAQSLLAPTEPNEPPVPAQSSRPLPQFFAPSLPSYETTPAPKHLPPVQAAAAVIVPEQPAPQVSAFESLGHFPDLPEEAYELARMRLERTAQGALLQQFQAREMEVAARLDPASAPRFAADYLKLHPQGAARTRARALLRGNAPSDINE